MKNVLGGGLAGLGALAVVAAGCGASPDAPAATTQGLGAPACVAAGGGLAACIVRGDDVAAILDTALAGTSIYLDTNRVTLTQFVTPSYVRLGPLLGGATHHLSLPFVSRDLTVGGVDLGQVNLSVQDVASSGVSVARSGRDLRVRFTFEDWGKEVKTNHSGSLVSFGDGAVPDVDLSNIAVSAYLTPAASVPHGARLYSGARATFSADVQVGSDTRLCVLGVCATFNVWDMARDDVRRRLASSVEGALAAQLASAQVRDDVSATFWSEIDDMMAASVPGTRVCGVTFNATLDATVMLAAPGTACP